MTGSKFRGRNQPTVKHSSGPKRLAVDEREKFITELVENSFDGLTQRASPLCSCRKFTFQRGESPNYDDPDIQKLYLARFAAAYYGEYHWVFENHILPRLKASNPSILSVGVGCGLDLAAFCHCLRKKQKGVGASFVGVDRADWEIAPLVHSGINGVFHQADLSNPDALDALAGMEFDIISFPRSLGEIYAKIPAQLLSALSLLKCKEHHFVVSFARTEEHYLNADSLAFNDIVKKWVERGFVPASDYGNLWCIKPESRWEEICNPWWRFPSRVYKGLGILQEYCPKRSECEDVDACKPDFERMLPIKWTRYTNWHFAEFTRKT